MKKILEKIETINIYFCKYIGLPFYILLILTILINKSKENEILNKILLCIMGVFLLWCVGAITVKVINKTPLKKYGIIPLAAVAIFWFSSLMIMIGDEEGESYKTLFYIGLGILEIYILYFIVASILMEDKNDLKNIIIIILSSLIFVVAGYYLIYELSFSDDDNAVFTALIEIFAAVIGGALTLIGVAWTIRHEMENKKNENILLNKPYVKLSNNQNSNVETICSDQIRSINNDEIIQNGIKELYHCRFEPIYLKNTKNALLITKGIVVKGEYYNLQEVVVEAESEFALDLTPDKLLATGFDVVDTIEELIVVFSDILGNLYQYKCNLDYEKLSPILQTSIKGNKITYTPIKYKIKNIGLPIEYKKSRLDN